MLRRMTELSWKGLMSSLALRHLQQTEFHSYIVDMQDFPEANAHLSSIRPDLKMLDNPEREEGIPDSDRGLIEWMKAKCAELGEGLPELPQGLAQDLAQIVSET